MVSNNAGLKYNYDVAMQAGMPVQIQGVDTEKIKQQVDNSYLANRAKASEETNPLAMLGVGSAIWYALGQGMEHINPKCGGKYEESLLGKLGTFGDKISTKTFVGRKAEQFIRWLDTSFDKLAGKSKIVYSLRNHSTRPEWSWAKTPGAGVLGFLAADTEQVLEEFMKPVAEYPASKFLGIPFGKKRNVFNKLEQFGMSKEDIKKFADGLKDKTFAEQALALQKKELEYLGVSKKMISQVESKTGLEGLKKLARNLKVRMLGFNSMREYNSMKGKILDNPDRIMKILERGVANTKHLNNDKGLNISLWRNGGNISTHFFGRKVGLSEYLNKYKAILGKGNNVSSLGRFLPKAAGWFFEGCTNRFAGGKLAVAMQAGIFADMLIHTYKAPKGEKGKTFIERFVNDFTYFLGLSFGIMAMHKVGGFKYIGVDNAGREAYRTAKATLNAKIKAGLYDGDKKAYKDAAKAVEKLLTENLKGHPIRKLLYKVGKLINTGNEGTLSYRSTNKLNLNWLRKSLNGNILGVPLRFLIPIAVVSPFLAKLTTTTAHAIFGRPTKSVLDEEEEPENTSASQDEQLARLLDEAKKQAQQPLVSNNSPTNLLNQYRQNQPSVQPFVSNNSPTNLLNMYKNGNPYKNEIPKIPDSVQNITNTTTINNIQNSDNDKQPDEPVRTYIPSPDPVIITDNADLSSADRALKRADAAEKLAMETLSMRR